MLTLFDSLSSQTACKARLLLNHLQFRARSSLQADRIAR